jgi:hypothetical protein
MQTFKVFDPLTGDESQVGAESAEHAARCWAEWMDAEPNGLEFPVTVRTEDASGQVRMVKIMLLRQFVTSEVTK